MAPPAYGTLQSSTPKSSPDQINDTAKTMLQLLSNCINNTEETMKVCAKLRAEMPELPAELRQIVDRIVEDSQSIVKLRERIARLDQSVKNGNHRHMKEEFQTMIDNLDTISTEKINMFIDVLTKVEASRVKKKSESTGRVLEAMNPNLISEATVNKFMNLLKDRNQKFLDCLNSLRRGLPVLAADQERQYNANLTVPSFNRTQQAKKLFILGENLEKSLPPPVQKFFVGNIIIEGNPSNASVVNDGNLSVRNNSPRWLKGFIHSSNESVLEEVELILESTFADTQNFTNLSQQRNTTQRGMTARFEHEGAQGQDSFAVVVLNANDVTTETSKFIALVESSETGKIVPVEVSIVPSSPEGNVHGRVVAMREAEKQAGTQFEGNQDPMANWYSEIPETYSSRFDAAPDNASNKDLLESFRVFDETQFPGEISNLMEFSWNESLPMTEKHSSEK